MKVKIDKPKQPKLIDLLHKALKGTKHEIERGGWHETIPHDDNCEWLEICLYDKDKNKILVHLYFTDNSTVLKDVTVYKADIINKPTWKVANTLAK